MDGGAGDFDAPRKSRFVDMQPIVSLAAESGQESGMHVQDAAWITLYECFRQDAHEARQNDHLNVILFQISQDFRFKILLTPALPLGYAGGDAGFLRAFQGVSVRPRSDDRHKFHVGQFPRLLRVDERLQIGAAAGDQHGGSDRAHARITPSFPSTTRPST